MNHTPYAPKDFEWTKWSATDIKALAPKIIAEKKARFEAVKKVAPNARNFENTVYAIEASDYDISAIIQKIDLLKNVSPDKAVREIAKRTLEDIEKQMLRTERDPKIWVALKDYDRGEWRRERTVLDGASKKLFHDLFLSYKRMGFDLAPEKQKRIKAIEERLAKLSSDFRHNINAHKDHILATEEELTGLPDRYKAGLKRLPVQDTQTGDKSGRYIVTLSYPDYHPFMELAHSETKRKEINDKFLQRGGMKNMKVLGEILALRAEHAKLLGYAHHADYRTELRMAKSGKTALDFEMGLLKKVTRGGTHDIDELRDLKRALTKSPTAKLFPHDVAYYGHKLQKQRFNFDSEEIRKYFPLARVLSGTLKIYATLFNVKFEKLEGFPLWHIDAELYAIKTPQGKILSYFALDLHPRDGKYGHAAAFGIISGRETSLHSDTYVAPFATMVANFPKPSTTHPSLLSHGEVKTFLHEFGHIMHYTLTTARYASQSGYHTAWDFVEAPSQMLEHWAWDKKPLALLSAHHKTGKVLPPTLLKNLLRSREHMLRYTTLRQLILGVFDLTLHTTVRPPEPAKLYRDLVKKYAGIAIPKNTIFPAGFRHLTGYDAGYYSYMWSNVYAADMFTRFEKEGIMNKKTGADYKKWILEKGGGMEELDLVKGFLGRTPSNKAFLKEVGIKE